jgi:hypothetical protein
MSKRTYIMQRRDLSKALLATAASSALLSSRTEAQTCTAPCYAQTAVEVSIGGPGRAYATDFSNGPLENCSSTTDLLQTSADYRDPRMEKT